MRSAAADPAAQPSRPWTIVGLLAAVLFINYVDRGALPTAAPLIEGDLGFSPTQLGYLFSAFYWSYALLQIPIGVLAERVGAQRVLAAGLTLWACATLLMGFAHQFTSLLFLRLLLGVGESAGFPCVSKLLAVSVPPGRLGAANGVVGFAYLFGPAVGTYAGGMLMEHFGWRSAFWCFGALPLLWLLPWSRVRLPSAAKVAAGAGSPGYREVLRQRALWGTSLGHFSGNYTFYFLLTWLPYYLMRERGFSLTAMASFASQAFLVNALAALGAGWVIDRLGERGGSLTLPYKVSMGAAHLGFVASMLCMAYGSLPLALGAILVCQFLSGMSSPGTFAIPQIIAGPEAAARWVGTQNAVANIAGIVGPALTGILYDHTHRFTVSCLVAAAISLLGFIGWIFLVREVAPIPWRARCAATA